MQSTTTLTCLYADYSANRLEKKKFEGIVFEAIRKKIPCMPGLRREDFEDFISWVYPRISRAIDRYHETGSSFEAYINSLVRLAAKEYRLRQLHGYNTEFAAWISQVPDMYVCEKEFGYLENFDVSAAQIEIVMRPEKPADAKKSRQLLILILKCCRYVSEDFLEKIAPKLGMDPGDLSEMVVRLKESREKREANKDALRELANHQFCRCIFYERLLQVMKDNPVAFERTKERLEHYRDRLNNTRNRLAKLHLNPSNAQIAKVLGLTKGTVDAVLHSLKARNVPVLRNTNQNGYDNDILN